MPMGRVALSPHPVPCGLLAAGPCGSHGVPAPQQPWCLMSLPHSCPGVPSPAIAPERSLAASHCVQQHRTAGPCDGAAPSPAPGGLCRRGGRGEPVQGGRVLQPPVRLSPAPRSNGLDRAVAALAVQVTVPGARARPARILPGRRPLAPQTPSCFLLHFLCRRVKV